MNGLKMPHVNSVILSGRMTRDPELRYTQSGVPVLNGRVASNSYFRGGDGEWKEETTFVSLVAWAGLAERCFERLKKGSALIISGRLNSSEWETSAGEKRNSLEVRADRVQFLDPNGGEEPETEAAMAAEETEA